MVFSSAVFSLFLTQPSDFYFLISDIVLFIFRNTIGSFFKNLFFLSPVNI